MKCKPIAGPQVNKLNRNSLKRHRLRQCIREIRDQIVRMLDSY